MEYICGVRVQKLEEKDNGTWSCILHYEKRGRKKKLSIVHKIQIANEKTPEECKKPKIPPTADISEGDT